MDEKDTADDRTPGSAKGDSTTSVSTRVWCADAVGEAQKILVTNPELLPPELLAFARKHGPARGGFPLWLVQGLGARFFLQWLEGKIAPVNKGPDANVDVLLDKRQALVEKAKLAKGKRLADLTAEITRIDEELESLK